MSGPLKLQPLLEDPTIMRHSLMTQLGKYWFIFQRINLMCLIPLKLKWKVIVENETNLKVK